MQIFTRLAAAAIAVGLLALPTLAIADGPSVAPPTNPTVEQSSHHRQTAETPLGTKPIVVKPVYKLLCGAEPAGDAQHGDIFLGNESNVTLPKGTKITIVVEPSHRTIVVVLTYDLLPNHALLIHHAYLPGPTHSTCTATLNLR